jgi:GH24 family phage-related lysozyme (muramidase)
MPDFLNEQEGLRLQSYKDSAGKWTIGYGSTMYTTGKKVGPNETITKQEAEKIRDWEIKNKSAAIRGLIYPAIITDKQMEMIVSLVYNIGVAGFASSTLLKLIKKNPNDKTSIDISEVRDPEIRKWMEKNETTKINRIKYAFLLWNKITNPETKKLEFDAGLFARRIREANGYLSGIE